MRLTIVLFIFLAACAKQSESDQTSTSVTPVAPKACRLIDACTYSGGLTKHPVYDCREVTHPIGEVDADNCVLTREDWTYIYQPCAPDYTHVCAVEVQGPGAKALP